MSEINSFDSDKKIVVRYDIMKIKKLSIAIFLTALMISVTCTSVAMARPIITLQQQYEERALERFMDAVEDAALILAGLLALGLVSAAL